MVLFNFYLKIGIFILPSTFTPHPALIPRLNPDCSTEAENGFRKLTKIFFMNFCKLFHVCNKFLRNQKRFFGNIVVIAFIKIKVCGHSKKTLVQIKGCVKQMLLY